MNHDQFRIKQVNKWEKESKDPLEDNFIIPAFIVIGSILGCSLIVGLAVIAR